MADIWQKRWHGYVGYDLHAKDNGDYCGHLGCAYPCNSYEDGVAYGLAWLRQHMPSTYHSSLMHTFKLEVRYF